MEYELLSHSRNESYISRLSYNKYKSATPYSTLLYSK